MAANTRTRRRLAEDTPTGTFGNTPAPLTINGRTIRRWSPAEQNRHLADLADAIGAPYDRPVTAEAA